MLVRLPIANKYRALTVPYTYVFSVGWECIAMQAAAIGSVEIKDCTDVDEQAECLRGYDARLEQLTSGAYTGRFITADLGEDVTLFVDQTSVGMRSEVYVPKDTTAIAVLVDGADECSMQGRQMKTGAAVVFPSSSIVDICSNAGSVFAMLSLPSSVLENNLSPELRELSASKEPYFIDSTMNSVRLETVRVFLRSTINDLSRGNIFLAHDAATSQCRQTMISYFNALLGASSAKRCRSDNEGSGVWARASAEFEKALYQDVSIDFVCERLNLSRRSLELLFDRTMGISPARYLKVLRLNNIRRDLLSEDYKEDTIGNIAARWGVWHPSRFASEYKAMFGEHPSDARRRFSDDQRMECRRRAVSS